jgi:hypothetical protein
MKLLRTVLYAALLLAASASIAQTRQGDVIADIPFPFVVARQTLPAGHYVVSPANADALGIHDANNRGTFVPTQSTQRSANDNSGQFERKDAVSVTRRARAGGKRQRESNRRSDTGKVVSREVKACGSCGEVDEWFPASCGKQASSTRGGRTCPQA